MADYRVPREDMQFVLQQLLISHPIRPSLPSISYTLKSPNKVSPLLIIIHPIVVCIKWVPPEVRFKITLIAVTIILLACVVLISLKKVHRSLDL